jgi:hypothetical protein
LGEIKSTIDLMMERTQGISLSAEERAKLRREDLTKKARGFKLKLVREPERAQEILSALKCESEDDRRLLESLLWELMIEEIPADSKILKYLDLMEKLPGAQGRSRALHRLREAVKEAQKSQLIDKKKILTKEKKKLAALGISGSAVVPKIPKESVAGRDYVKLMAAFRSELLG